MGIEKGAAFVGRDVYIDYSYMKVMFRSEHATGRIFARGYGQPESSQLIPDDNHVFNDATLYGVEISRDEYLLGK